MQSIWLPYSTVLNRILPDFTIFTEFFTKFLPFFHHFYGILPFTVFYRIPHFLKPFLPYFTVFYCILPVFTLFYRFLPYFAVFQRILMYFLILQVFTVFHSFFPVLTVFKTVLSFFTGCTVCRGLCRWLWFPWGCMAWSYYNSWTISKISWYFFVDLGHSQMISEPSHQNGNTQALHFKNIPIIINKIAVLGYKMKLRWFIWSEIISASQ